jgi:hypothetical protein
MNDIETKAYKRLVRLLVVSWVAVVILLFIVVSLLSYQIAQVRSIALDADGRVVIGPIGPAGQAGESITGPKGSTGDEGPAGPQGPQGVQGVQGVQGETGATGQDGAVGATGPQGPQGEMGAPGRIVYVREERGKLECRYEGSDEWTPIEECQ